MAGFVDGMKDFLERQSALRAEQPTTPPFSEEEYRQRLERARARMAGEKLDLLFVTAPESMCYLHGYAARWYHTQSTRAWPPLAGTALHVDHDRLIHFDQVYEDVLLEATSVARDCRYYPRDGAEPGLAFLIEQLRAEGWLGGRVGLEYWSCLPNRLTSDATEAAFAGAGCSVVDGSSVLLDVRRVKSAQEIAYIEEAARIVDAGAERVREVLQPGITELEVWAEMMLAMARAGGEPAGIHELVTSGPFHTGHGISSQRQIQAGELITIDPCGVLHRYHANLSRSFWIGEPPAGMVEAYRAAGGAFPVLCQHARHGARVGDVVRELRRYYEEVGLLGRLPNAVVGYELGIAFPPDWVGEFSFDLNDVDSDEIFEAGMVTNYESFFATYLLDTVVYEGQGARTLSKLPHELIVVERS